MYEVCVLCTMKLSRLKGMLFQPKLYFCCDNVVKLQLSKLLLAGLISDIINYIKKIIIDK